MFVVTLPSSAAQHPTTFAAKAKKAGADVLEIRSDLTPNVQLFRSSLPILLALRGTSHDLISRIQPSFIDCEIGEQIFRAPRAKLILSFHDYKKTPPLNRLLALVKKAQVHAPWAVKIATQVNSMNDLVVLFELQKKLRAKKIRSIVLGMGEKAHLLRLLSPLRNEFTYAALDGFDATASGQLPLSMYKFLKGKRNPAIFGILGGPHITASLSPLIHNALFRRHKIDAVYSYFPSTDFLASVRALSALKITGLSVTAPFKHDAFSLSRKKEKAVRELGVANTLVRSGKQWASFNTDWFGIAEGYPMLRTAKTVAILGAGGAVPSVILATRKNNPHVQITVYARDPKKAKKDLAAFTVHVDSLKNASKTSVDVVVCAISDDVVVPMPKTKIAIDLRYGKTTKFMTGAKKKGIKVYDGLPMLIHQALAQFKHFTGVTPSARDAAQLQSILSSR